MIPKRVFSPSLTIKSLTSENRLKGNRRLDCDSQASSSSSNDINSNNNGNSGTGNQTLSLDTIKDAASIEYDKKVIGKINIENGKDINDKNNSPNKQHNDGSQSEKERIYHEHQQRNGSCNNVGPKSNHTELVNNLIGTPETAVEIGNCHRNIHISLHGDGGNNTLKHASSDVVNEKIELSRKRCDVETTINNVPLRDVIQRKVTKLPNQLLNSSKEFSSKLATAAASTTTKNVSRTKRLLFRRKTAAVTKDQIEVAKKLTKNSGASLTPSKSPTSSAPPISQHNETFNECSLSATPRKVPTIESNYIEAIDTIRTTGEQYEHLLLQHQQQQYLHHQSSTSAKQKQANAITIVTDLSNAKRKNAKTDNKYKLDDVNGKNAENIVLTTTSATTLANDNVSTSKRYYFKQTSAANKIKSEHFASQTQISDADCTNEVSDKLVVVVTNKPKTVNERNKHKPPPYIDPPSPQLSSSRTASPAHKQQSNHSSLCELQKILKNHKTENDLPTTVVDISNGDDEHGNYAVPYVQSPTDNEIVNSPASVVNSTVHIRIANQIVGIETHQVNRQQQQHSAEQQTANKTKSQSPNNRVILSRQQKRVQVQNSDCKDNKDSTHDKSTIDTEILLLEPIGQSFSSGGSSASSDSTGNESDKSAHFNGCDTNQHTKMDPNTILNLTSPCDMLTKPEFSSSHLQNIPVRRPRKGVPHLENYCLFDPSKDFVNEKELKKKYGLVSGDCMPFPIKILDKRNNDEELIKETIYEDQDLVYDTLEDVKEEDEDETDEHTQTTYPNYFTIDPEYIEENKMESIFTNANHLHPIVESETEDIYSDTNANLNKTNVYENQQAIKTATENVVPLKKSPQIEKIVRQSSQPVITTFAAKKMISSTSNTKSNSTVKNDSSQPKYQNVKVPLKNRTKLSPPNDLPLRTTNQSAIKVVAKKRNSMTMKHSVSTPQLSLKDLLEENAALPVVEIEIKNTASNGKSGVSSISNRSSQYKLSRRPASQHSDADSGFLSPATPTDAFNQGFAFPQFDTIQGYIDSMIVFILILIPSKRKQCYYLYNFAGNFLYPHKENLSSNYGVGNRMAIDLVTSIFKVLLLIVFSFIFITSAPLYKILFTDEKEMIIPVILPFFDPETDKGFSINLVHQLFCSAFGSIMIPAIEIVTCIFKNTVSASAAIIEDSLTEFGSSLKFNRNFNDEQTWKFRNNILRILDFNRYVVDLIDFYYWKFFLQPFFLMYSVIISIYLYLTNGWITGIGCALCCYVQLIILCDIGRAIEDANVVIEDGLKQFSFYLLPPKKQKMFGTVLGCVQNGAKVGIGPLAQLNYDTATKLTKTIYTYTMLMLKA